MKFGRTPKPPRERPLQKRIERLIVRWEADVATAKAGGHEREVTLYANIMERRIGELRSALDGAEL